MDPFLPSLTEAKRSISEGYGFFVENWTEISIWMARTVEEHFIRIKTPMILERIYFGRFFKRILEGFHGHNTQMVSRVVLGFSPGKTQCFLLKQAFIDAFFVWLLIISLAGGCASRRSVCSQALSSLHPRPRKPLM